MFYDKSTLSSNMDALKSLRIAGELHLQYPGIDLY